MKISSQFVTLSALNVAAAFFVQAPTKSTTALNAFSYGNVESNLAGNVAPVAPPGAPLMASTARAPPAQGVGIDDPIRAPIQNEQFAKAVWETTSPVTVQGGSLRTCSFATPAIERVQVLLKTEGRPLNANVELWHGPDNTPHKMAIYSEDGSLRPFSAVVETPRGHNAIAIRNTGHMEFPLLAVVEPEYKDASYSYGSENLGQITKSLAENSTPKTIQGGAIHTYPFSSNVASVQVMLTTDGRPLNARLELLQGPNNNKQVIEIYTEDGLERPFFVVIETPGTGNVVRCVNTATVEFPMYACVEPYHEESNKFDDHTWDNGGTSSFNYRLG